MRLQDNTELNVLNVSPTSLRLYDIPSHVVPYTVDGLFHVYHMEGLGRRTKLLVDGQTVFDITRTEFTGGTLATLFGDGAFSNSTVSEWDYVRINSPVPEPLALLSVAAGSLCLARPGRGLRRGS